VPLLQDAEKPAIMPWLEIPMGLHTPVRVRWAGDRCSVCDSDVDYDFDQLVSCDACGITVHQSCYGVPEAPGAQAVPPPYPLYT
jgi:PHD-finger